MMWREPTHNKKKSLETTVYFSKNFTNKKKKIIHCNGTTQVCLSQIRNNSISIVYITNLFFVTIISWIHFSLKIKP